MSYSTTFSESATFTITHAKHMAAKVATDLKRIQRFYTKPSDFDISQYEEEVIVLLNNGYLGTVTYGFWRNDAWIEPTLKYTARDLLSGSCEDNDPGRIRPGADITGASFYSYLTYSINWDKLSYAEKETFKKLLPFKRGGAPEPSVKGYFTNDKVYSAGGRALDRAVVRSY